MEKLPCDAHAEQIQLAVCRKLLGYRLPTFIPHFTLRKKWGTSVGESLKRRDTFINKNITRKR